MQERIRGGVASAAPDGALAQAESFRLRTGEIGAG
jgi:hypothetical protein